MGALSAKKIASVAEIDQALPGPVTVQPRRAYYPLLPGVSSIQEMYTAGTADYHSLQTSLEHRFAKGWNLITNYTYGHLIDDHPCRGGCKMGSEAGPFPVMSSNRRLDRGNSDIDLRHRWSLMASYAPSFGAGLHGVAGALARGWQLNAIAVMQSGGTFTVQNSSSRANTGSGDRPNLVGDPYAISQSPAQWFNTAAFATQPLYTLGTVGRNTMYGPPMRSWIPSFGFPDTRAHQPAIPRGNLQHPEPSELRNAGQFPGRVQLRRDLEHRQLPAAQHPVRAEIAVLNGDMMAVHLSSRGRAAAFLIGVCCAVSLLAQKPGPVRRTDWAASNDWPVYHGSSANIKYSTLDQVTPANVRNLREVWRYSSTQASDTNTTDMKTNPLIIDGTLYGLNPQLKLFALDAATGKVKWVYDPVTVPQKGKNIGRGDFAASTKISRGVAFYRGTRTDQRILYVPGGGHALYCVEALTGKLIPSFGDNGIVDMHDDLDWSPPRKDLLNLENVHDFHYSMTSPGIIYKDMIIVGSRLSEGPLTPPGHIRAYDVHTGKRRWIFHTIPQPGEPGYEGYQDKNAYKWVGGANAWGGVTLDETRGIIFAGTGSTTPDFWGGNRKETPLGGSTWSSSPAPANCFGISRRSIMTSGTGIIPPHPSSPPSHKMAARWTSRFRQPSRASFSCSIA